ncbi:putative protein T-ENOL isoform X3 [Arvicola amphibius]|uniref:putative protein T-ENOL isoform X3 n=1 Tax=Arvicola amphibius TaxID=1047088 RepID=UPI0018E2D12F|nr:putative protein T-ENOL isoform X3 [Arvicola amphibius]
MKPATRSDMQDLSQVMASTSARIGEKKDSWPSQAAAALGGGQKVSLSRSEEFLSKISAELTDEALFIARSQPSSPRPVAQTPALTEIAPAPRHTFCHLLVKRECSPIA